MISIFRQLAVGLLIQSLSQKYQKVCDPVLRIKSGCLPAKLKYDLIIEDAETVDVPSRDRPEWHHLDFQVLFWHQKFSHL